MSASAGGIMKIKVVKKSFEEVLKIAKPERKKPARPPALLRWLMKTAAGPDLRAVNFRAEYAGMDGMPDEPCLVLMNHSSFVDLEIAARVLYPHPFNIVCTSDGFVGKERLMRSAGCIPVAKFVTDTAVIADMSYALRSNGCHVLLYPEASYSFDGRATPLPRRMGVLFKRLGVPVVMIKTEGAFSRDPLYNSLQKRRVDVKACVKMLFSANEVKELPAAQLSARLEEAFDFDNFRWQQENGVRISESFRADGLERILYKCADCGKEGGMQGRGTALKCESCGAGYELSELGFLEPMSGSGRFSHIPDWYEWERREVRKELEEGRYLLDCGVRILVFRDYRAVYDIGEGRLVHGPAGFTLEDASGKAIFSRPSGASYSLYADYFWYEIGDVICIGDCDMQFCCLPKEKIAVAKARLAAEELYKMSRSEREGIQDC